MCFRNIWLVFDETQCDYNSIRSVRQIRSPFGQTSNIYFSRAVFFFTKWIWSLSVGNEYSSLPEGEVVVLFSDDYFYYRNYDAHLCSPE